ncbi:hypothetical protein AXFE_09080 [Acidithrix ferrooxidans]|uniref:Uncharacterized protein n=1 Tax=Acidithrix ferrooxidans TaxID=1280514 RepID=A0A0D8HJP3_9ACTN|nr:hypothetical protein AXFE_09080 [Acidithrix ferrooxidans]
MLFDLEDKAFREEAEVWLTSLDDSTIVDLEAVFEISPGYYPTTLLTLWELETQRRHLPSLSSAGPTTRHKPLPVSHPFDADWRFTIDSSAELVSRAVDGLSNLSTVVHIGTHSTYRLGVSTFPQHHHVLLDRNSYLTETINGKDHRILAIDLSKDEVPYLQAESAILDPPWYLDDTLWFLDAASRVCSMGASVLLCQPSLATRPGVMSERAQLLELLPALGLLQVDEIIRSIGYRTPHFEAMSLRASSVSVLVPDTWRHGDLLVLSKVGPTSLTLSPPKREEWSEVQFGPVRIKIRSSGVPTDLMSLVPGNVLKTVSRRDPVRQQIGFWTSGNRIFGVAHPKPLETLIEMCNDDLKHMQFTLSNIINHGRRIGFSSSVSRRLFDVLLLKLQEHMDREHG